LVEQGRIGCKAGLVRIGCMGMKAMMNYMATTQLIRHKLAGMILFLVKREMTNCMAALVMTHFTAIILTG
jgi:hypothetical protein